MEYGNRMIWVLSVAPEIAEAGNDLGNQVTAFDWVIPEGFGNDRFTANMSAEFGSQGIIAVYSL